MSVDELFRHRRPPASGQTTSIRIAALLLAEEANTHCGNNTADHFHQLAAAATLLEQRMEGKALAAEAIILGTPCSGPTGNLPSLSNW
ncbi:hypothetical protein [Glycomyces sp. NPDC047010]|uniref:hypothetical protein n=1 Tax=Glycomyces sp. NPDC047010 TaxID=3155023 RepID=UPI0033F1015A